jgi:D-alanyl-D-alanine carboxypeptidase
VTQNFNKLIGRYPGADGFKTGFICASGYNLVASATRNGKRLIAVVLGASSGQARAVRAAQMLERGFGGGLGWLKPALGTVDSLAPIDATPPNLRDEMCGGKRKRPATDEDADVVAANGSASTGESAVTFFTAGLQPPAAKPADLIAAAPEPSEPIPVYTGPTKTGTALIAAVAADTEKQTPKRGKKSKVASKKPDAAKPKAETAAKPAAVRHASAKSEAAAKPAASAEKKAAAKPAAAHAPKSAKPNAAAKPKGENKPAG